MNVHEAIRQRYSIRSFLPEPVTDEQLMRLLDAARLAPSSSNRQDWRFVVVRDPQQRQRLAQAAHNQMWIAEAPVIIAAVGTDAASVMTCGLPRHAVDVSIAMAHMMLAAVEEGLGTCWIGLFSQDSVREILGVGRDCVVVTIMPVGHPPARAASTRNRKTMEDIVRYEVDSR